MIGVQRPDHIVFCGPAGNVLRELMTTLDPELPPAKLHLLDRQRPQPPVPTGSWNDRSLDQLDRFVGSLPLDRHDRLLAVDLGWNPQPHTWLWEGMKLLGHDNRIDTALIGLIDRPTHHGPFQIWAFGADPSSPLIELARATTEVLDALLVEDGGTDQAPGLRAGIQAFAEDLEPWLALGPRTVTAALVEPALRIMHSPTYPEAQLLGRHQVRRDGSDEPVPLASLPPRSLLAKDPALLHQAGDLAPWPQGYRVLAAGDPTATSTRLARRVGRRRSGSVQPL
jgi:hypothetical protein